MADKLYHRQPCFCMPCRVLRKNLNIDVFDSIEEDDKPVKKQKKKRKPKA